MAKIGLNNFRYAILTEAADGTPSYGGAKKPAKAVSCSVSITNNDAKLYADDGLAEADTSFQSGTVSMGIDDEDQATMAELLGHTVSDGEMIRNAYDTAPYVGIGRVIVKMVGGQYFYRAEVLLKCKMSEPSQESNTRSESIEFGTSTLEGTVATLANGDWSRTETFATKAEAISYIEGILGGSPSVTTKTVTYDVTTNGGTNAPSAVTVPQGTMIALNNGSGITPPSSKVFAGWDSTSSATTPDFAGGASYIVSENVTLYAIFKSE